MKTLDEMIAVMQAAKEGKAIEQRYCDGVRPWESPPFSYGHIMWNWQMWDYRVKPTPKRVPLGPEDVDLHRDLFRPIDGGARWGSMGKPILSAIASLVSADAIRIEGEGWVHFEKLVDSHVRSRDGGKTWQPCSKEVA